MDKEDAVSFRESVYLVVSKIPPGRVMSYGDVAALAGSPLAARVVGQIAHYGPPELPWHRVVNRFGGLASGYYGGKLGHKAALESEGVAVDEEFKVALFKELRWHPK